MQSTSHQAQWQTRLRAGDVVRFRFPVDDPDNPKAKAKCRPCLILGVRWYGKIKLVEIAYGTGAKRGANRGFEIRVKGGKAKAQAGLTCGTRFIGTRVLLVSVGHSGFEPEPETGTPIIGHLDASCMRRLLCVKAMLKAHGDTAPSAIRARRLREQNRDRQHEKRGLPERNRASRVSIPKSS